MDAFNEKRCCRAARTILEGYDCDRPPPHGNPDWKDLEKFVSVGKAQYRGWKHRHRVRVTAPPDGFIAPPGYYLLFVSNNRRVPSVAKFIHLDLAWEPWFALGPNTFPLGSEVAAVSTQPGGTSLCVVGLDEGHGGGRVWTNSFPDRDHPDQWVGWRPLGDNVFRPGSPVTALSLAPGATSLYLMGLDGQIWGNFFP